MKNTTHAAQIDMLDGEFHCYCGETWVDYCDADGNARAYDADGEVVHTHVTCHNCGALCDVEESIAMDSGDYTWSGMNF